MKKKKKDARQSQNDGVSVPNAGLLVGDVVTNAQKGIALAAEALEGPACIEGTTTAQI